MIMNMKDICSSDVNLLKTKSIKTKKRGLRGVTIISKLRDKRLLHGLYILLDDVPGGTLGSVISNDSDSALNSLLDGSVLVELAQTAPLGELLALIGLDEAHVALSAQSLDKLGDLVVVTVLGKNAQKARSAIQSLGALVETTTKSIVLVSRLKHLLKGLDGAELLLRLTHQSCTQGKSTNNTISDQEGGIRLDSVRRPSPKQARRLITSQTNTYRLYDLLLGLDVHWFLLVIRHGLLVFSSSLYSSD